MKLYHFTTSHHLEAILTSGYLMTVESNVSLKREHAGPDVVWLTTHDSAEAGHGLKSNFSDKTEIRFTVDVDKRDAYKWRSWARSRGSSVTTIDALSTAGGSSSWWVATKTIPASQWVEIRDMVADEILLDRSMIQHITSGDGGR